MTNDRFTEIKENINEALGVEYRYWDDWDNARDDMLWLLGEVARLRDNYAIFGELAPPDLPRASFARLCYEAFEEADDKNHHIEQLEEALRVAAQESYRRDLIDTRMEWLYIGAEKEYADKDDFIGQKIDEWLEEAKGIFAHGHDNCLESHL